MGDVSLDDSIFAIALVAATAQAQACRDPHPLARALAQATKAGVPPTSEPMVQAISLLNALNQEVLHPRVGVHSVTASPQLLASSGSTVGQHPVRAEVQSRAIIATVESPTIGDKRVGKMSNGRVFRDDGDDVSFEVTVGSPGEGRRFSGFTVA